MTRRFAVATAAITLLAMPAAAQTQSPTLADLLAQGYEIKATELVTQDVLQRAMGAPEWKDDLLITLQRGSSMAFCHGLLQATTNTSWFVGIPCTTSDALPTVAAESSAPAETTPSETAPAETAPAATTTTESTTTPAEAPATN